jgi:tRNA pseudouridine55 synthase
VRTYTHEIGLELGCGAHLAALRRTKSGRFSVGGAVTVEELKSLPRTVLADRILSLPAVSRLRGA